MKTIFKTKKKHILLIIVAILTATLFSCKKEEAEKENAWIVNYSNVLIGDQHNYTKGHFFKPQTYEVIFVEDTADDEQYIGLFIFTESGGSNLFFTFPANGEQASSFGTSGIRLFDQVPGGIDNWQQENLVSGMIYKTSMTAFQYDTMVVTNTWDNFNNIFKENNQGDYNLNYNLGYELNPESGNVYLIQFSGVVRAIVSIKDVVPSSYDGGILKFDITIEGRESYENNSSAENMMPDKPST